MIKLIDFVSHLNCPSINGIKFPDETVQLFDIKVIWGNTIYYNITTSAKTSINVLKKAGRF